MHGRYEESLAHEGMCVVKIHKEIMLSLCLRREIKICGKRGPSNVKNCVAVLKQMKRGSYNSQFIYFMPYFP